MVERADIAQLLISRQGKFFEGEISNDGRPSTRPGRIRRQQPRCEFHLRPNVRENVLFARRNDKVT